MAGQDITREQLAQLLNEDLSREYQAIIAYVVYSQVPERRRVYEHRRAARAARASGARACADHLAADRLSRRDAERDSEAGQDPAQGAAHAEVRPRQRECHDPELPGADSPMRSTGRVRSCRADTR